MDYAQMPIEVQMSNDFRQPSFPSLHIYGSPATLILLANSEDYPLGELLVLQRLE
jgi:hypothetical protein